jgi:hypothetical protein
MSDPALESLVDLNSLDLIQSNIIVAVLESRCLATKAI